MEVSLRSCTVDHWPDPLPEGMSVYRPMTLNPSDPWDKMVPSTILEHEEFQGEAVAVVFVQRHDSTQAFTMNGVSAVTEIAERWARWHGGEWVANYVVVAGEYLGPPASWTSWRETILLALRRKDGTGIETLQSLAGYPA